MYHRFLIHSSADGHLGCFHVLAIINSAAMNIGVHVSLSHISYIISLLCYIIPGPSKSFSSLYSPFVPMSPTSVPHSQILLAFNPEPSPGSCPLLLTLQMPPLLNSTSCFLCQGIPTGGSLGQKCCSQPFSLFIQLTHRF